MSRVRARGQLSLTVLIDEPNIDLLTGDDILQRMSVVMSGISPYQYMSGIPTCHT